MKFISVKNRPLYIIMIALWLAYAALSLSAPQTPASIRFNLSSLQIELIRLTILIPMLVVWLLALYGAIRFRRYAQTIRDSTDGKAMSRIATGLGWFVVYILLLTLIGSILPHFRQSPYLDWLISGRNLLSVATAFLGFYYVYSGAAKLTQLIGAKVVWTAKRVLLLLLPYCIFAMAFTYLFFINPDLNNTGQLASIPTYVLPPAILLYAIVIPYLFMWLLGVLSVLNLRNYASNVPGVIYRKVLSRLARGMIGVICFIISLQLLNVLVGTISQLALGSLLLIIYLLILMIAISYGSIASGARRLAKIEASV